MSKMIHIVLTIALFATYMAYASAEISDYFEYYPIKTYEYLCENSTYPHDVCMRDQSLAVAPINCTDDSSCSYRGRCNFKKTGCICDAGYTTFEPEEGTQCNYKQMSRFLPFFLEFFFPYFGVGHFVLGNIGYGVGQIIVLFLCCCLPICLAICTEIKNSGAIFGILGCLICIAFVASVAWYIETIVRIGTGYYTDEHGVETYW